MSRLKDAPAELTTLEAQFERDEADATTVVVTDAKKPKRGRGQPMLCTPEVIKTIAMVVGAGNYLTRAAEAAGIAYSTLQNWRSRGERGIEPYATLNKAIDAADRECEQNLVKKVMAQVDDDWRAAAHLLERKYPERWSRYRERALIEESFAAQGFIINIHLETGAGEGNAPITVTPSRALIEESEG